MRLLSQLEINRLTVLTEIGLDVGLLEPTKVALDKGIIDAVAEFRRFLERSGIHDFDSQPQGQASKQMIPAELLTEANQFVSAEASLYKPVTKKGDPRIWFSKLKKRANPNDILAISFLGDRFYVFNLTGSDLVNLAEKTGPFRDFLEPHRRGKANVVEELLGALAVISAKGFIQAIGSADTTVGMLLEAELGIAANSRRSPDYNGIEIKAARGGKKNRHNLFAQVPDWGLSQLKSSNEVLQQFGYVRDGRRQLYCTVAFDKPNTQTLFLDVTKDQGLVRERSTQSGGSDVVSWSVASLENSLLAKHAETFWVTAESKKNGGDEQFWFTSVEHTADPIIEQFVPLIQNRDITMDHLVREKEGRAAERGPLFKLKHGSLELLFPPSKKYVL